MNHTGDITMYAYRSKSPIVEAGLRYQSALARQEEDRKRAIQDALEAERRKWREKAAADRAEYIRKRRQDVTERLDRMFSFAPRLGEPTIAQIAAEVADKHRISLFDLRSHRRSQPLVWARQEAMYRCRTETSKSYPQIGRFFRRDHTTVIHAVEAYQQRKARSGENGLKSTGDSLALSGAAEDYNRDAELV